MAKREEGRRAHLDIGLLALASASLAENLDLDKETKRNVTYAKEVCLKGHVHITAQPVNDYHLSAQSLPRLAKERSQTRHGLKLSRGPDPRSFHPGIAQVSAMARYMMGLEL